MLATTAVGADGSTQVMGGNANLWNYGGHSVPGNATEFPDSDGVYRRMLYSFQGLETFGTAIAAHTLGTRISPKLFGGATASVPIDFAGPPGTVSFVSYKNVFLGHFPASLIRGKTVIIGATSAILQDVHQTATSGSGSGGNRWPGLRSWPTRLPPFCTESRCATPRAGSTCC